MTFHLVCTAVGLTAVRFIHSNDKRLLILGYSLLVPSLNFAGLLLLLPALSMYRDHLTSVSSNPRWPSWRTITILTSAILYYSTVQIISPPHGQFSGGNFIIEMTGEGVSLAILGLIKFSTYLLPTILGFFVLSCLNRSVLTRKIGVYFSERKIFKNQFAANFSDLFYMLIIHNSLCSCWQRILLF